MADPAVPPSPSMPPPPPPGESAPPPDRRGRFWVLLGLALLVLPILGLVLGMGIYLYVKSDRMVDTFERIQQVEDEAAAAEKRRQAERENELLAEFNDAFSRENLAAAARVMDRLKAEAFDSERVQAAREALEKAQAAAAPAANPGPTVPPGAGATPAAVPVTPETPVR